MNRPDLRSPRAVAEQRREETRFAVAMWAWAFLVSLAVAVAVAPTVIAKAQHDAAHSRILMEQIR